MRRFDKAEGDVKVGDEILSVEESRKAPEWREWRRVTAVGEQMVLARRSGFEEIAVGKSQVAVVRREERSFR